MRKNSRLVKHFISFLLQVYFNSIRAQMLNSIHHMTFKLLKNCILGLKTTRFGHLLCNFIMALLNVTKSVNH